MLEMKITITATELAAALNNLASALEKSAPHIVCSQHGSDNKSINNTGTINLGVKPTPAPTVPVATADPTPVPSPAPVVPAASAPAPTVLTSTTAAPTPAPVPVQVTAAQTVPATAVHVAPAIPTAAPQYTLEMIATAGSALIDAGKLDQLMALLQKFGVDSLTSLSPKDYGAIASDLRLLGARI